MKKNIIIILTLIALSISLSTISIAQINNATTTVANTEVKNTIKKFIKNYNKVLNKHNIKKFRECHSSDYTSADNLDLDSMINLTKEIWENYPNMKYTSEIKNIRVSKGTASIELVEKSTATSKKNSEIIKEKGKLKSEAHYYIYLKNIEGKWKIINDKVNYEFTSIVYGSATDLDIKFSAPEIVPAGENYTATLIAKIPNGLYALGSITKEEIIYPNKQSKEVFKEIQKKDGILERLLKANTNNHNEVATASIGITEVIQEKNKKPEIQLTGISVLSQRVNVIPNTDTKKTSEKTSVIESSIPENLPTDLPKK